MVYLAANNQVLVSTRDNTMEAITDPMRVGGANYGEAVLTIHTIFVIGGTSADLTYTVQGSNDGQTFFDLGTFTDTQATESTFPKGEEITCAFVRIKFSLAISGTNVTDWGSAAFDLHLNLINK